MLTLTPIALPLLMNLVAVASQNSRTLQSVLDVRRPSICRPGVCLNGGRCIRLGKVGFRCRCANDFFGDRCEKIDPCRPSPCAGGSTCQQNPVKASGFDCVCSKNLVGNRCQVFCPSSACKNGGTCRFSKSKQLHCICPTGFRGKFCDKASNACASNPCRNGACSELTGGSHFCNCYPGWMGPSCDRPCRDIYQSCNKWQREDQCDSVRTRTKFFDVNCAHSCQRCVFKNETVGDSGVPLPPILEPLSWMIGQWASASNVGERYPVNFGGVRSPYVETLNIKPAPVTMFGTPSIDFTSTSHSENNDDIRMMTGYLTIKERTLPVQTALMCVGNDGMTTIEKGVVDNNILLLNMTYMQIHPSLKLDVVPLGGTRLFQKLGDKLIMTVKKLRRDSSITQFSKTFTKTRTYSL